MLSYDGRIGHNWFVMREENQNPSTWGQWKGKGISNLWFSELFLEALPSFQKGNSLCAFSSCEHFEFKLVCELGPNLTSTDPEMARDDPNTSSFLQNTPTDVLHTHEAVELMLQTKLVGPSTQLELELELYSRGGVPSWLEAVPLKPRTELQDLDWTGNLGGQVPQ